MSEDLRIRRISDDDARLYVLDAYVDDRSETANPQTWTELRGDRAWDLVMRSLTLSYGADGRFVARISN